MLWTKEHKLWVKLQTHHSSCDRGFYAVLGWLQQIAHLFEAEGHGEHADSHDAVHHVHDQPPVGRRHLDRPCDTWDQVNIRQHVVSSGASLRADGDLKPSDSSDRVSCPPSADQWRGAVQNQTSEYFYLCATRRTPTCTVTYTWSQQTDAYRWLTGIKFSLEG